MYPQIVFRVFCKEWGRAGEFSGFTPCVCAVHLRSVFYALRLHRIFAPRILSREISLRFLAFNFIYKAEYIKKIVRENLTIYDYTGAGDRT